MKKLTLTLTAMAVWAMAGAVIPQGYYNGLEGKKDIELKKAAKAPAAGHKEISYSSGTWDAFESTDVRVVNGVKCWWDMYSDNNVAISSGHPGLNVEHSVANSWWGGTKNAAYKDLFHLNPSDQNANSRKSNYPLAELESVTWTNGVTSVGKPKSGQGGGNSMGYEPADEYKGDFARVFMYMFTTYDDINWQAGKDWMFDTSNPLLLKPWAVDLILKWHRQDPVSQKELDRNEAIYKIQGNRNPYIDHPELAEYIWGNMKGTVYHLNGAVDPTPVDPTPVDPTPDDPTPTPEDPSTLLYCDFERGMDTIVASDGWYNIAAAGNLTWFTKAFGGNTYASASAYKGSTTGVPYEMWLITPKVTVPEDGAVLTFRTQGAYGVLTSHLEVYTMDSSNPNTAKVQKLPAAICTPNPSGSATIYSDWKDSGDVALAPGAQYIGFKYISTTAAADGSATYCVDDVKITGKVSTGVSNVISTEGQRVFTVDGREIAPADMTHGIYILVSAGGRTQKILR